MQGNEWPLRLGSKSAKDMADAVCIVRESLASGLSARLSSQAECESPRLSLIPGSSSASMETQRTTANIDANVFEAGGTESRRKSFRVNGHLGIEQVRQIKPGSEEQVTANERRARTDRKSTRLNSSH